MDLAETVEINKQIQKLIEKKHGSEGPPDTSSGDYTYYQRLSRDIEKAEEVLERMKGPKKK